MKKLLIIIVSFWIVAVTSIVTFNEHIYTFGKEVRLKVTPIDPRDFLRGDYVSLNYEISSTDSCDYPYPTDVYVELEKQHDNTYSIKHISSSMPENGIFIKGNIHCKRISYNEIEKYFVKEGSGKELEQKLQKGGIAIVRIDTKGNARLKKVIPND